MCTWVFSVKITGISKLGLDHSREADSMRAEQCSIWVLAVDKSPPFLASVPHLSVEAGLGLQDPRESRPL